MNAKDMNKFWPLMYAIIMEYWAITEPHIERAADERNIPSELYYYSELGMNYFSLEDFQNRDPFTNPERFGKAFANLEFKGWIIPAYGERYQVTRAAQDAVRQIVAVGDAQLSRFASMSDMELTQIAGLLKKILKSCLETPAPPDKWATITRFRALEDDAPVIAQIREVLMYLFAYRDDSHLAAARPHFGQGGIVWSVLGYIWKGEAITALQMAERMTFRGYDESEYAVAIQAGVEIGWLETADAPDTFRPTRHGHELRELVEKQTDEYFYRPWRAMSERELDRLATLLTKLREQLAQFRASTS